MPATLGIVIAR